MYKIALRPGDGTGPEVVAEGLKALETVAANIDQLFAHDEYPTATRPERAFVGRVARDIVYVVLVKPYQ